MHACSHTKHEDPDIHVGGVWMLGMETKHSVSQSVLSVLTGMWGNNKGPLSDCLLLLWSMQENTEDVALEDLAWQALLNLVLIFRLHLPLSCIFWRMHWRMWCVLFLYFQRVCMYTTLSLGLAILECVDGIFEPYDCHLDICNKSCSSGWPACRLSCMAKL